MQVPRPHQWPVGRPTGRKTRSDFESLPRAAASYLRKRTLRLSGSFDLKPSSGSPPLTPARIERVVSSFRSHSGRWKSPRGCMATDQDNLNETQSSGDGKGLPVPQTGSASESEGSQTDGSFHSGGWVGDGYVRRPSMERTWHGTTVS